MPLAEGFEEIEAMSVISVLRGNGITLDTVGIAGGIVSSESGTKVVTDRRLPDIREEEYDGIVIPGGRGCNGLERSKAIMDMIRYFNDNGKLVAGICFAPMVLAKAGVLDNRKATVYPGHEKEIPYPRSEKVVVDGNVITSQGPANSLEFALTIVERLLGKEKAEKSRRFLLA